jgi:hypothetical protein
VTKDLLPDIPTRPTMRVLYIGGWGRSGSTLLGRMLGGVTGFFVAGELREVWTCCLENRLCGCGEPFRSCEFWMRVGEEAFGGWEQAGLAELARLRRQLDRQWSVPILMAPLKWVRRWAPVRTYVEALERLYTAIQTVSGAKWIVDSSKLPSYALLLRMMRGVDLRVLHLVRDSRGVMFSWQKHVARLDSSQKDKMMLRYSWLSSSLRYDLYNLLTHRLPRLGHPYLLMRYEDLIADPRSNLGRAVRHAGVDARDSEFGFLLEDGAVSLGPNHMVDGNPLRFTVGRVPLQTDEAWRSGLSTSRRVAVSVLTSPLLLRYGYARRRGGRVESW